jgi:hypothetical protein
VPVANADATGAPLVNLQGLEEPPTSEIQARAKAFITKARQKMVEDIKQRMGERLLAYNSIRSNVAREATVNNMLGRATEDKDTAGIEGMVATGDGRLMSGGLKMDLKTKRVMATSYNEDWSCIKCTNHRTSAFKIRGEAGANPGRQVILLTDQSYPAILPVASVEKCLLILRIENASLSVLVDEFTKQLENRRVPQDS